MWKRKGILLLVLCLVLCVSAFAEDSIQLDALGSISLTLSIDDKPVPGGEISLYQVGNIVFEDGVYGFAYVEAFKDCNVSLEGDLLSETLARSIWDYAANPQNRVDCTVSKVNQHGQVLFDGLPVGLYLVCQTDDQAKDGYLPLNPFLISVPFMTDDGYTYHVVADPKCNIDTGTTPPPSPPPSTPPGIPDTGQENWPVPVLAISGLLIFAFGWAMRFNGRNRKDET